MARYVRLQAVMALIVECCPEHGSRWVGGEVMLSCPACGSRLGTAWYEDPIVKPPAWTAGEWLETRLDAPLVPTGLDPQTGDAAYGLRNRARGGATKTRGRVSGRAPIRESKETAAGRAAVIHCWNDRCGARLLLDIPTTWPETECIDVPDDLLPVPSEIEWQRLMRRPTGEQRHFTERLLGSKPQRLE